MGYQGQRPGVPHRGVLRCPKVFLIELFGGVPDRDVQ